MATLEEIKQLRKAHIAEVRRHRKHREALAMKRELRPHDSSNLKMLEYNGKTLLVRFHSAKSPREVYRYANVTEELWLALISAESIGSAFHLLVRRHPDQFPYKRLSRRPKV